MLSFPLTPRPRRVLMTLDAVGGIWRYALDLARGLNEAEVDVLLVGFGPAPEPARIREIETLDRTKLVWMAEPLDWMAPDEAALAGVGPALQRLARDWRPDLVHLNLPSQAADLSVDCPIVVATHSCLASWWQAVREGDLPAEWRWQRRLTGKGLRQASRVLAPSASHVGATLQAHRRTAPIDVVHNATSPAGGASERQKAVLAAGRWWDDGKNVATLDAMAALSPWPVLAAGPLDGPNGQSRILRHALPLGDMPPASARTFMEHVAVFVSPSLYEPFGLAVLEAAWRGAALVLADIPTFRELWDDAALFVPPRDAEGFARMIATLAERPQLRARLAREASRRAHGFGARRQVEGVLACYARALGGSLQTHDHVAPKRDRPQGKTTIASQGAAPRPFRKPARAVLRNAPAAAR